MISRNLFIKLQKEDLKRRLWTIALSILIFFLSFPVFIAMRIESFQNYADPDETKILTELIGTNSILGIIITITGAIICAFSGFFYLHSRKKVDLYHSIPVKRETLFAVNYLNGILIYFIPYLINVLVGLVIIKIQNYMNADIVREAFLAVGMNLLYYAFIYTVIILAVMLTGNFIISCLATVVFFGYGLMLSLVKYMYFTDYFSNYYSYQGITNKKLLLSPVGTFIYAMYGKNDGENINIVRINLTVFVLTVLFVLLAVYLYKKRPSEAAGKAMAFPITKPIIKFLLVIPLTLTGGIIFRDITNIGSTGWLIFGLIFTLILSSCMIEIIYNFDIKSAFHKKKQMLILAGITAIILVIFEFDVFHYDSYIPKKSSVESMSVGINGLDNIDNSYYNPEVNEFRWMDQETYQLKYMKLENIDSAYDLAKINRNTNRNTKRNPSNIYVTSNTYCVKFHLKNGRDVYRQYTLEKNQNKDLIENIFNDTSFKEGHYEVYKVKADQIVEVLCYNKLVEKSISLNLQEKNQLLELYKEELDNFKLDELISTSPVATVQLHLNNATMNIYVYPSFIRTIEFLESHGFDTLQPVTAKDIKVIKIHNYNNLEDAKDESPIDKQTSSSSPITLSYTKEEQKEEIFKNLIQNDYFYRNDLFIQAEVGLDVEVIYKIDEYGNEKNEVYLFKKGCIPEFVKKDTNY